MPTISVVIPTHNRASFLPAAIQSALNQTYRDFEIIVVDDGSTDETQALLADWIKAGTVRYHHQEQAGVSAARNRGVELARGRYIAFLDSDDLFMPAKLEKQMAVFEQQPELGFVHCGFNKVDEAGRDLGYRDTSQFRGHIYPEMLQEWDTLMAMPCMLMRKDALQAVGGFDEAMAWAEDLDLWRRIAKDYPVDLVPEPLVAVTVHPTSATSGKVGAAAGFERYLEKAFADDPDLSPEFKRRAYAGMYANLGQNLLGEGGPAEMRLARQHLRRSLGYRGRQPAVWATWLASWLPRGLRHGLASALRRLRYPATSA